MKYKIQFTENAEAEANAAYDWIAKDSAANAVNWFNGLVDVIETLEHFPERCTLAPEGEEVQREIRQLIYGKYRILFFIHDESVFILHVRHGAQQPLPPEQV